MPIFPRRQLQLMLDELGPWLTKGKAKDLLKRIEMEDPDQSIPGEYELGIGWGLSKLTDLEIGHVYGRSEPDFVSIGLFPEQPAVIEVTALSDAALSGEASMERTANIINQFADTIRKGANTHLHYTFGETSGHHRVKMKKAWGPFTHRDQYFRRRLTSLKFTLTHLHKSELRHWLATWPPSQPLRIEGEGTAVTIVWKEYVHPSIKTFSSMPSEVHDLKDNPVYERLKEKEKKQLRAVPDDHLKCIFLGDAGCTLLRDPFASDATRRRVNGRDIIQYFLQNSCVDMVVIFSPRRENEHSSSVFNNPRAWKIDIFDKWKRAESFYAGLRELCDRLPKPYLHGYQARSWKQQGMLDPQARGQYLPAIMGHTFMKLSARALLELLAGRMANDDIKKWITGDHNPFEHWLAKGYAISDIELEAQGANEDDDYVVIKVAPDPNGSRLRLPPQLLSGQPDKE
ncbi:MAG TPA: hypothetical protein VNF99_09545 [Stellaceae bacterium]|nr:hypothetical protein [Stellaceae bacterium]